MRTPLILRLARLGFAALALTAIAVQLLSGSSASAFKALNFFSFFTIQGNLLAIVVLLGGVRAQGVGSPARDGARGATVFVMLVIGIVFALLLSNLQEDLQLTKPWVDAVLHQLMPLVAVADWVLDPPRGRFGYARALRWLAFPALWALYTFVRGAVTGWYPYPFLDPTAHGTGGVAVNCVAIVAGMVLVIAVVVAIGNARRPVR